MTWRATRSPAAAAIDAGGWFGGFPTWCRVNCAASQVRHCDNFVEAIHLGKAAEAEVTRVASSAPAPLRGGSVNTFDYQILRVRLFYK